MKTKFTKAEQEIIDWYKVRYCFDTAKNEEDKQAAIKYLRDYCEKYKLNFKRKLSHIINSDLNYANRPSMSQNDTL